jgi:hypothetical protein
MRTAREIDRRLANCLAARGVEHPLADLVTRATTDPVYAHAYQSCVRNVVPDLADRMLTGDLSPAARIKTANEHQLDSLRCAIDRGEWKIGLEPVPIAESGFVDVDALIGRLPENNDVAAFVADWDACRRAISEGLNAPE